MSKRALILADTDSRLKWGVAIGHAFAADGFDVVMNIVPASNNPSPEQVREMGHDGDWRSDSAHELLNGGAAFEYDVLVLGLAGTALNEFIVGFHQSLKPRNATKRQVLMTGYWGVTGMQHAEGILWRQGCDVICVNSHNELRVFSEILKGVNLPSEPLVVTGFSSAQYTGRPIAPASNVKSVLFIAQSGIPSTRREKSYILDFLIKYALRYPERRVVIKPRCRPDEHATHRENFHFSDLYQDGDWKRPENLEFYYGPIESALEQTDLMLTISSAAAFEAWVRGITVALISDMGINDRLANAYYVGSGAFTSLEAFCDDAIPEVNAHWLADHGLSSSATIEAAIEQVHVLMDRQEQQARPLDLNAVYFTKEDSPLVFGPAQAKLYDAKYSWSVLRHLFNNFF